MSVITSDGTGGWVTTSASGGMVDVDLWSGLPTTGSEGDYAYLRVSDVLLRWSDEINAIDSEGRKWIPNAIYDPNTGTGVSVDVVEWLEPIDCVVEGEESYVTTWPSRAGTGDCQGFGVERPTFDAVGGPLGPAVVFDGADAMYKLGGTDILNDTTNFSIICLTRIAATDTNYTWWSASVALDRTVFRAALYGTGAEPAIYARPNDAEGVDPVTLPSLPQNIWRVLAGAVDFSVPEAGRVSRGPNEADSRTALSEGGSTSLVSSNQIIVGAYSDLGGAPAEPLNGKIGALVVLRSSKGAARAVAAWLNNRLIG